MSKMGLHDPFGHLKHKLWPKERPGVKLVIWFPTTKSRQSIKFPHVQVVCDIPFEKLLTKATILLQTSFQSKGRTQTYGAPKLRKSQPWEFQNSHLGIPGQNAIWMWASWKGTKYTIRGKVVTSPKSGPWWVSWVRVCPWLVLTPEVLQLCTNQLVVWFCVGSCEWVIACHSS
jgi:hypothetical protein